MLWKKNDVYNFTGFFLFMIYSVLLITWKYYDIIEKIVLYEIWDTALNYERHQTQWFEEARNRGLSQHFLWQAHQIQNVHSLDLIIDQAYAPKKKERNWYDNPSPSTVGSFLLTVHFHYSKVHTIIWFKLSIRRSFLARLQSNKGRPSKLLAWNWWNCKKWILCFFFIGMVTWGEKQNYSFQTMQFMMHTI